MTPKMTGLAAFTKRSNPSPPVDDATGAERQRGKKDVVALTVRLQRSEWERLHQLAVSEGLSIQSLAVRGLNRVFTEKGLAQLSERNSVME